MNDQKKNEAGMLSRRRMLKQSASLLVGGAVGGAMGACAAAKPAAREAPPTAPPLPWKWVELDPLEAGRRAYRNYPIKGGCGSGTYLALLSLLKRRSAIRTRRYRT